MVNDEPDPRFSNKPAGSVVRALLFSNLMTGVGKEAIVHFQGQENRCPLVVSSREEDRFVRIESNVRI